MGARTLTVEELDRRHAEKRAELLAKQEKAAKAKLEREAGRAGARKFEILRSFLERNELELTGYADGSIGVEYGFETVGILNEQDREPLE